MKFLATILSVYIVVLITIPCVDVPFDNNPSRIHFSGKTSGNHQGETDHCTPFCPCDCCMTPAVQEISSIHLDCLDYTYRGHSDYSVSYTSALFAFIWQPPKLS